MPKRAQIVTIVIAILLLLATGAAIYFYQQSRQQEQKIETLTETKENLELEIEELDKKIRELETSLQDKDLELEEKERRIEELNQALEQARRKINELIKRGRLSQQQVEEYKFRLEQMQYYLEKYQKELAQLKEENIRLKEEKKQLEQILAKKDTQTFELEQKVTLYETQLKAAAVLKAADFSVATFKRSGKEVRTQPFKARLIRRSGLKICFNILENPAAKLGKKDLFIVIEGPDGTVYKDFEKGSGYFTYNDKEEVYTLKRTINYDRTTQTVCALFKPTPDMGFPKGIYRVSVYCEGYLIGSTSFEVR